MKLRDLAASTLLAALAAAPLSAQTDSPLRNRGVDANDAAETLIRIDKEEDAAAERGETPEPEAPVVAAPLPAGSTEVGGVLASPLEETELPDPEADAEDPVTQD